MANLSLYFQGYYMYLHVRMPLVLNSIAGNVRCGNVLSARVRGCVSVSSGGVHDAYRDVPATFHLPSAHISR